MKIKGKIALQNLGSPNKNGRIYSEDLIKEAILNCDYLKNKRLFITRNAPQSVEVDLADVVGVIDDLYIKDNNLIADVSFIVEDKNLEYYDIRPNGIGNVDENGVVSNYEFISFSLTNDPA